MFSEHRKQWLGHTVADFTSEVVDEPIDPSCIYRLRLDYDSGMSFSELFERFIEQDGAAEVPGIIIGMWFAEGAEANDEPVQLLAGARNRLPNLRGIFFGELLSEESEVSWIEQGDVSPLFLAYPALEHFRIRGSNGLTFGSRLRHLALRSLVIETGGLPGAVVREVLAAELPQLEELQLWLGTDGYGGDVSDEDLAPLLAGKIFPNLRRLGLRNAQEQDHIAKLLAVAPITERLRELDLSLGTLSDEGAEALLASPAVARLKRLDLHRHYLSDEMMRRLTAKLPHVDVSEQESADGGDDRYVAVSE